MRLGKILDGAGVRYCLFHSDVNVLGVTDDSRKVRPGKLFIAVRGMACDGHAFLRDALARGACAVVVEDTAAIGSDWPRHIPVAVVADSRRALSAVASKVYGDPARRVRVIGITGTNGKTTVSYYLRSILSRAGYQSGVMGTISHDLCGLKRQALNTTPGPLEIHENLRDMEARGVAFAVMEVSSHALDQGRVAGIPFIAGIHTNVTSDHLDYHGCRKEYLKAKARLFGGLGENSIAVLNSDDWASAYFASSPGAKKVRYGRGPEADLRYRVISAGLGGSVVFLTWKGRPVGEVRLRMPGLHNAANAAAAAAFGLGVKLGEGAVVHGLEKMKGVPGRLEEIPIEAPFKVFVDYAHTDNALEAVLTGLRAVHSGRINLVFGCGGDRDRTKRPRMGRVAGRLADRCWLTSDNPRTEDPDAIIRDIERGMPVHAWYAVEPERVAAIREAMAFARPGDAVLIAGKGHETTQTIGKEVREFNDGDVVRSAWAEAARIPRGAPAGGAALPV
jgi:UDP-N-acetylmuramoyl-L-alanyl-D-glutamate--2,6-diaminopimelate ligase